MTWKVERWGGNANHKRRVVFLGSEDKATERYWKIYQALRQGYVALINPEGRIQRRYGSARGRSPGNIIELQR
jgi:hypothetical protein